MTTFAQKSSRATKVEARHETGNKNQARIGGAGQERWHAYSRGPALAAWFDEAQSKLWLKEIAPSTKLRKWFGHDPKKWRSFRGRYQTELKHHADQLKLIKSKAKGGPVTLIYGARDQEHNEAVVLNQFLKGRNKQ